MKSIGVLGGKGMLGSDLVEHLGKSYQATAIDRENYDACKGASFDVLINANGNSKRYWANQNPLLDFDASTISVYQSLIDFKFQKYVYISSSNVYPDHDDPSKATEAMEIKYECLDSYGFHKYLGEQIVRNRCRDWLVLRSSMILGSNLKKGPVYDILKDQPLFVTFDSRLQMITTRAIADIIQILLEKNITKEVFNIGGRSAFSFENVQKVFEKKPPLHETAERQVYEMNVEKLGALYSLKTSDEYLQQYLEVATSQTKRLGPS